MKQHLIESMFTGPGSSIFEVKDINKVPKKIKESFDRLPEKQSLNEGSLSSSEKEKIKKILKENNIPENVINNISNNNSKRLWRFPISKINDANHLNYNGRAYTRKLWENVLNNQSNVWKGRCGLSDHPSEDKSPSFKDQSILWLDAEIDDTCIDKDSGLPYVFGYGVFVGPYGKMAEEILDYGGGIGFSSSGWGDFLSDKCTVDPDTYEIERLADMVLDPSQGVYGNANNVIENIQPKTPIKESLEKINEENNNKNKFNKLMENGNMVIDKVNANIYVGFYENQLNTIKGIKSSEKRLEEATTMVNEMKSLFDEEWLESKEGQRAKSIINEAEELISNGVKKISDLSKVIDNTNLSPNEISEKLSKFDSNSIELSEAKKLVKDVLKELDKSKLESKVLREKLEDLSYNSEVDESSYKKKILILKRKTESLNKTLENAKKIINSLKLKEKKLIKDRKYLLMSLDEKSMKIRSLEKKYALLENKFKKESYINNRLNSQLSEAEEKNKVYRMHYRNASKNYAQLKNEMDSFTESQTSTKHYVGEYMPEELREDDSIKLYLHDLERSLPESITPTLKEKILNCKTLKEAQNVLLKNLDKLYEDEDIEMESDAGDEDFSEDSTADIEGGDEGSEVDALIESWK